MERYCTNCGSVLPEDAVFCTECGQPVQAAAQPAADLAELGEAAEAVVQEESAAEKAEAKAQEELARLEKELKEAEERAAAYEREAKKAAAEAEKAKAAAAVPATPVPTPVPVQPEAASVQPEPAPAPGPVQEEAPSKTVSTAKYFWLMLVFVIPVVGLIVYLIMAFAGKNKNLRNFARAHLIWLLIGFLVTLILGLVGWIVARNMGIDFSTLDFEATWQAILKSLGL